MPIPPRTAALALALAAPLAACGGGAVDNSAVGDGKPGGARASERAFVENSAPARAGLPDIELPAEVLPTPPASAAELEVASALEAADLDRAAMLLRTLDSTATRPRLLRARLLCRRGRDVEALREVESARRDASDAAERAEVAATAAELYCQLGRPEAAADEIRAGLALAGEVPALERARGILLLSRPGGARAGLAHLERALELDPSLPFTARPRVEAQLLVGRTFLREENPIEAVKSARAGLELDPDHVELRKLHADALLAAGALRSGLAVLEELLAEGEPLEHDVALAAWRAGMGELVSGRRPQALECFVRARELGMGDESLGSAAQMLSDESAALVVRGVERYRAGAIDEARGLFAEALHHDPGNVAAENHLAVVHFRLGAYRLAIEGWERVLADFDERGETPPEPVHANAAQAWIALGRLDAARGLLEHYEGPAAEGPLETEAELVARIEAVREAWRAAALPAAAGDD